MKRIGLALLCLVACGPAVGDDGNASGDAESSGTATGSGTTPTTTAVTTETVTSAGTTVTTSATTSASTSATSDSGESGETTTTAGSTTGSGPACVEPGDCQLFATCCDCEAVPVGEMGVDSCPEVDCESDWCAVHGISDVQCTAETCAVVRTSCNPNEVICALAPPDCDPGFVPGTADGCWTGQCVPAELCDYVPSCEACPDDRVCVDWVPGPKAPILHSCEPIPSGCGSSATCDCAADLCIGWGDCFDRGTENHLSCVGA